MSSNPVLATSTQVAQAQKDASAIEGAIPTSVVGGNEFVFFAAFDSTNNGADPQTDGSDDTQNTAIFQLSPKLLLINLEMLDGVIIQVPALPPHYRAHQDIIPML